MADITTIALIGAGQLGSRHLQALGLLNRPVKIEVVEPFLNSVTLAKERLAQVGHNVNIKNVQFFSRIEEYQAI
jgi:ornithine cyclodeaminase/alanine dehydrogenase-like protein (mu-crystallin family)